MDRTRRVRALTWDADAPTAGDELRTARGRRYEILAVRVNRVGQWVFDIRSIDVAAPPPRGRIFGWCWTPRKRQQKTHQLVPVW